MTDSFKTIVAASEGLFKDRGSKFLAYAFPVANESEIQERQEEIRKLHSKARHHCYAWKLGLDDNLYRANDDGEPSGTAGRPILGQLESFELTNVLIIVVRYFGGTLLGTSGLIQAYRQSAQDALEQAEIVEKMVCDRLVIQYSYAMTSPLMQVIKQFEVDILEQDFQLNPNITLEVQKKKVDEFLLHLKAQVAQVTLEEAETIDEIPELTIDIC